MYGEVLSTQAAQELDARIKQAEHARRARMAGTFVHRDKTPKRKAASQRTEPWPAHVKAADPQ